MDPFGIFTFMSKSSAPVVCRRDSRFFDCCLRLTDLAPYFLHGNRGRISFMRVFFSPGFSGDTDVVVAVCTVLGMIYISRQNSPGSHYRRIHRHVWVRPSLSLAGYRFRLYYLSLP